MARVDKLVELSVALDNFTNITSIFETKLIILISFCFSKINLFFNNDLILFYLNEVTVSVSIFESLDHFTVLITANKESMLLEE